jgi:hypothetical protein
VQRGDAMIAAARVWTWSEAGQVGEVGVDGLPLSTQRMYLQGDVVIALGSYRFTAVAATVWIQTLDPSVADPSDPDARIRQVAVQFDRVADPGAQAGFSQAADRLLVTARLDGTLMLRSESISPGRPDADPQGPFLRESEARFAGYLRSLIDPSLPEADVPMAQVRDERRLPLVPGRSRPFEPGTEFAQRPGEAVFSTEEPQTATEPLFARDGVITFAVGTSSPQGATSPRFDDPVGDTQYITISRGEDDNTLQLTGGILLQYRDVRKGRTLQITAERAVVFLEPGPLTTLGRFSADRIRGIYVEGDVVATDGQYNLRGPRVYYDLVTNQALMVDAVFSTFDTRMNTPIYVRARALRQEAANQFSAEGARLSTSSFFTPMFSIGASNVIVTQKLGQTRSGFLGTTNPAPTTQTYIEARGITPRLGGVPFLWLPGFKGELDEVPLEDIRIENSSSSGTAIKTSWNLWGLLNTQPPAGLSTSLLLDGYFDRGFAGGTKTRWLTDEHEGQLFAYGLPSDSGRDQYSTGARKDTDDKARGLLMLEDIWKLDDRWTLNLEFVAQSDPGFVDAFFKDIGQTGRELSSGAYLRRLDANSSFTAEIRGSVDTIVPNQYLLQSQGYVTTKAPEFSYTRLADDVLPGVAPGFMTWTHEYRFSRMRLDFAAPLVKDFGFDTLGRSKALFGVTPDQSIGDALFAQGLRETDVLRGDTRQELRAVIDFEPFKLSPFVVGRFTGYDKKIEEFLTTSNAGDDQYRWWVAAGTTVSTEIVRVDDAAQSDLFDINRVRHIIRPNITGWTAGTNVGTDQLPIFDADVEALNSGSAVKAGISQVWQTKRGGPGRWHDVDLITLDTDFVFSSSDADRQSPIGRFFDYRPEYAVLGNYFTTDMTWKATDAISVIAGTIYDMDIHQSARTTVGGIIQHWPEFSTFGQLRYINALDATYVDFGANYLLTRIYSLSGQATYDTNVGEFQSLGVQLRRRMPDSTLGVNIGFNNITGETRLGVFFEPQQRLVRAADSRQGQRLRSVGR